MNVLLEEAKKATDEFLSEFFPATPQEVRPLRIDIVPYFLDKHNVGNYYMVHLTSKVAAWSEDGVIGEQDANHWIATHKLVEFIKGKDAI